MSPVSFSEHEVSPSRRSLSPPADLAAYSKNRAAAKQRFQKPITVDRLAYEHECSSSVKG